jgi:hypothetical protein
LATRLLEYSASLKLAGRWPNDERMPSINTKAKGNNHSTRRRSGSCSTWATLAKARTCRKAHTTATNNSSDEASASFWSFHSIEPTSCG